MGVRRNLAEALRRIKAYANAIVRKRKFELRLNFLRGAPQKTLIMTWKSDPRRTTSYHMQHSHDSEIERCTALMDDAGREAASFSEGWGGRIVSELHAAIDVAEATDEWPGHNRNAIKAAITTWAKARTDEEAKETPVRLKKLEEQHQRDTEKANMKFAEATAKEADAREKSSARAALAVEIAENQERGRASQGASRPPRDNSPGPTHPNAPAGRGASVAATQHFQSAQRENIADDDSGGEDETSRLRAEFELLKKQMLERDAAAVAAQANSTRAFQMMEAEAALQRSRVQDLQQRNAIQTEWIRKHSAGQDAGPPPSV